MVDKKEYCNPVSFSDGKRHTNPDPYVMRWCGKYYCYATDEAGVKVSVSEDLVSWEAKGFAIRDREFRDYWAPAVIYLDGIFYMYYSNIPADETDCHEEHLKLAVSKNPEGPFEWKKTFFNKFSIDAHPILWNGRLYLFYSVNDWIGTDEKIAGTCILLDEMKSPEEFAGNPGPVVVPGILQEIYEKNRFGDGRDWYTIEGAAPVIRGNRFWLLYSANAYVNVDYYIGTSVARCKEELLDMTWKKYPDEYTWKPLLRRNEFVEGTGHNTVVKAPNMVDEWIVYHGRNAEEELDPETEQREMRIDPLYFNGDELLCFGPTVGRQEAPAMPEIRLRDLAVDGRRTLGESALCYEMELWISAKLSHTGARYSVFPEYQDERNYLEIQVHSGRQEISVVSCRDGIRTVVVRSGWEYGYTYDYTVPHLIRVSRGFENYTVILDETQEIHFTHFSNTECGTVEIASYFTELMVHSFDLTRTVMLRGKELQYLGKFYDVSACMADENGLTASGGKLVLRRNECMDAVRAALSERGKTLSECGVAAENHGAASDRADHVEGYTEVFLFAPQGAGNRTELLSGEESWGLAQDKKTEFSLYHTVQGDQEWFLVDGERMEGNEIRKELGDVSGIFDGFILHGLKIVEYQCTKK